MEWMTVQESAEKWKISTRRAQYLCAGGKVAGAQKLGNIWVIPKDTPKPIDGRTKKSRKIERKGFSDVKTKLQGAE